MLVSFRYVLYTAIIHNTKECSYLFHLFLVYLMMLSADMSTQYK
jgi:hypothetical protein